MGMEPLFAFKELLLETMDRLCLKNCPVDAFVGQSLELSGRHPRRPTTPRSLESGEEPVVSVRRIAFLTPL